MTPEIIAIIVLAALFIVSTIRDVHLGVACAAAAWLVGVFVFDATVPEIAAGFPADLFITLVGVTFLFALAEKAGAISAIVYGAVKLVGGRVALMPWVIFVVTALIAGVGAATPAAAAIVGPIAMGMARKHDIHPVLMGMAVIQGASAGSFSPMGVYGMIINEIVDVNHLPGSPAFLFGASFVFILLTVVVCFFAFDGIKHWKQDQADHAAGVDHTADLEHPQWSATLIAAIAAIVILGVLAFGLDLHIGFSAMVIVVVFTAIFPAVSRGAVGNVTWSTVLLVCGVVMYVNLLQNQGVVDWLGHSVAGIGAPLLAALVICLIAAVVSALASTTGILGALVPLAVPFLLTGEVWAIGLVAALAISASVVDCSPFSTNGALMVAFTDESKREPAYRSFMAWGFSLVIIGPVLSWLALVVVPGLAS
ncbi:MAG: hypothetical protein LBH13_07070 [Cellulomonadaceae bacterium]|jgi:di/tricarboxylate transporter|nr:hypothetical protein [Cellulomonadaceae bacterium]